MKKEKDPTMQIYNAGANLAIYHIAKAFCVKSADIRVSDMKIRDKAKLLVERILEGMEEKRELEETMDRLTENHWRNMDPWECCGQERLREIVQAESKIAPLPKLMFRPGKNTLSGDLRKENSK